MTLRVVAESTQSTIEEWSSTTRRPTAGSGVGEVSTKKPKDKTDEPPLLQELSLDSFVCRFEDPRLICYSLMDRQCVVLAEGRDSRPEKVIVRAGGRTKLPLCKSFEVFIEM